MSTHQKLDTVIVLDLDGTLIPDQEAFRTAATAVLQAHLPDLDPTLDPVADLLDRARRSWRTSPLRGTAQTLGVSSWETLWSDPNHKDPTTAPTPSAHALTVWADTLTALGGDPRQSRSAAQMLISQREALSLPYPGARESVEKLASENRLWLVTHGSSSLQRRKLHLAGLEKYFEFVFISAEIGFLKDQDEFVDLIERSTQVSHLAIRTVIGDSDSDLRLAARLGRPAVHICSHRPCEDGGAGVEHEQSLADWALRPD